VILFNPFDANGELVVQNANGKKCSNAKSYSILIDTDGKFGGTGPNKILTFKFKSRF
jgi:hypothetical protein